MMHFPVSLSLLALFAKGIHAVPSMLQERSVTPLSASALSSLAPFTQFAKAAYCASWTLKSWNCGEACTANARFQPTLVGGDGNIIQRYFVGFWPDQNSIVVSHQGTDPTQFFADLTDLNVFKGNLNTTLFPGVSSNVEVHAGFRDEHQRTASTILNEVKRLMSTKRTKSVVIVGHSLGGALALLDALFLTLNLPSDTLIKLVTYGSPRVGNPAFAQLIDAMIPDIIRVNNKKDIVPIVPGRSLGFEHVHGEIHLLSSGNAVSCPLDDDATDAQCQIKSVPNILVGNILDHLGPYEGIFIGGVLGSC